MIDQFAPWRQQPRIPTSAECEAFAALVERLRKSGAVRVQAGDLACDLGPLPANTPTQPDAARPLSSAQQRRLAELEEKVREQESLP